MSNLNSELKKIIDDLEKNIKDKDDLEIAKIQMFNLYNLFFDEISNLESLANSRVAEVAERQASMEERLEKIQKGIKDISVDLYGEEEEDHEDCDIEIDCPYCNKSITICMDELQEEITCPECKNVIELDWGQGCSDEGCKGCTHHCHYDEDDDI